MPRWLAKMLCLLSGSPLCAGAPVTLVRAQAPASTARAMFDFHRSFWVNLHHSLYMQAVPELPPKDLFPKLLTSVAMAPADTQALAQPSSADRAAWRSAVDDYAATLASRELVAHEGLHAIMTQLAAAESSADLAAAELPATLKAALLKAAPNQGLSGFEILFHESSPLLSDKMQQAIDDDTKVLSAGDPAKAARVARELRHAAVFYTADALTAERLRAMSLMRTATTCGGTLAGQGRCAA